MRLLFADSAFNDLASIQAYYLEQGTPNIGDKFVAEIIAHAEVLEDHPEIGCIVPEFDEPKIRELIHPPFRIVYWLDNQTIHVIRIWRSERLLTTTANPQIELVICVTFACFGYDSLCSVTHYPNV